LFKVFFQLLLYVTLAVSVMLRVCYCSFSEFWKRRGWTYSRGSWGKPMHSCGSNN